MISTRFFRTVLLVALHEYDHNYESDEAVGNTLAKPMREVRGDGAMPTWQCATCGFV